MTTRVSRSQPSREPLTEQQLSRLIDGVTVLIVVVLLALIVIYPLHINHDAALFLDTGKLILDGKQPYIDFDEINFPLIMYLSAIPTGIARVLGVNPIPVFSLLVLAIVIGSLWTIRHILRRRYTGTVPVALQLIPTLIALYTIYLFLIAEYGQREHLFILLFLPGFMLRWVRWQEGTFNRNFALLVGVMAGIGTAIKPHFLVIAFAPEIFWIASASFTHSVRRIRSALFTPEVIGFVGFGVLYTLLLLLAPTIRQALFEQILPYISSSYANYGIGVTPLSLLWRLDTVVMWIALLAALPLVIRNRPLVRPLWVLTFAAILVFCWQGKGWYYHRIPAIIGVILLMLMTVVERNTARPPIFDAIFKVLLVLLTYSVITLGGVVQMTEGFPALHDAILKYSQPDDPVMFISSSVDPAYPLLVQTGRRAANRNLSGYPVGIYSPNDPNLAGYLASLAQSIDSRHPPLILIDTEIPCYGCSPGYGMWQYLQQTGFIAQKIAPDYTDLGEVNLFELYVRK